MKKVQVTPHVFPTYLVDDGQRIVVDWGVINVAADQGTHESPKKLSHRNQLKRNLVKAKIYEAIQKHMS